MEDGFLLISRHEKTSRLFILLLLPFSFSLSLDINNSHCASPTPTHAWLDALAAENDPRPVPRCFSRSAQQVITGEWRNRSEGADREGPEAAASAFENARWYSEAIRGSACRALDEEAHKDRTRFCRSGGGRLYRTVWLPHNCKLASIAQLLQDPDSPFTQPSPRRTLDLLGDSLLTQLFHSLRCVFKHASRSSSSQSSSSSSSSPPALGNHSAVTPHTRVTVALREINGMLQRGKWPVRPGERADLREVLSNADAIMVNLGAHYNLVPHCASVARKRAAKGRSSTGSSSNSSNNSNGDGQAYPECSPAVTSRLPKTLALAAGDQAKDLEQDAKDFLVDDLGLVLQQQQHAGGGGGEGGGAGEGGGRCIRANNRAGRIIWRETLPQHFATAGGVFVEDTGGLKDGEQLLRGCRPIAAAADTATVTEESSNTTDSDADAAEAHPATAAATASAVASWRNRVVQPFVEAAGVQLLPTFDVGRSQSFAHPPTPPTAPPDCTHFCIDSGVSAALATLALNVVAEVFASFPPPPPGRKKRLSPRENHKKTMKIKPLQRQQGRFRRKGRRGRNWELSERLNEVRIKHSPQGHR